MFIGKGFIWYSYLIHFTFVLPGVCYFSETLFIIITALKEKNSSGAKSGKYDGLSHTELDI